MNTRCTYHWGYRDDEREEDGESEEDGEGDEEEPSEEGGHVRVDQSAPKGGGIRPCFVARVAFWRLFFFLISRQCSSWRVGFVSTLLIILRSNLIYTRLDGLRAVNSSLPVGFSSVFVVCRVCFLLLSCDLFLFVVPCQSPNVVGYNLTVVLSACIA